MRTLNLSDRVYAATHLAMSGVAILRWNSLAHGWWFLAWNVSVCLLILGIADRSRRGPVWEFAHDWLPSLLFITVFEELSFLSPATGLWHDGLLLVFDRALGVPPWLYGWRGSTLTTEILQFGYMAFYPMYPFTAGVLWGFRHTPRYRGAFRVLTDSLSVGYAVCYLVYLVLPTRSPLHTFEITPSGPPFAGPFDWMVQTLQSGAGVHGNAFPSGHIMLSFVCLVFVWRYFRRFAVAVMIVVLLMCVAAVVDGYHFAADVVAGALIGVVSGIVLDRRTPDVN